MIPYKLFSLFLNELDALEAGDELIASRAAALGASISWQGSSFKTQRTVRRLAQRAHPVVRED